MAVGGDLRGDQDRVHRAAQATPGAGPPGARVGRRGCPARLGRPEPGIRPAGAGGPPRARAAQAHSTRARFRRPAGQGPRPPARSPGAGGARGALARRNAHRIRPRRRVPGHRRHPGGDPPAAQRRRVPHRTAIRGRRREAVDLPVPRRRAGDLPPLAVRVPRARADEPDRELPERAGRRRLRQRAVRRLFPQPGPGGVGRRRPAAAAHPRRGHLPADRRVPLAGPRGGARRGRPRGRRGSPRRQAIGARAADDRGALPGPPAAAKARRRLARLRPRGPGRKAGASGGCRPAVSRDDGSLAV